MKDLLLALLFVSMINLGSANSPNFIVFITTKEMALLCGLLLTKLVKE